MAIPNLLVDVHACGQFQFLCVLPRCADRGRTQHAMVPDGRLKWRIELLMVPFDDSLSSETICMNYSGVKPAFDLNAPIASAGLMVGEYQGATYMLADDFQLADDSKKNDPSTERKRL